MRIRLTVLAICLAAAACAEAPKTNGPAQSAEEAGTSNTPPAYAALSEVLAAPWRTQAMRDRDQFRHPAQTLEFCQVDPAGSIAEIWPGSGWYTAILEPWVRANNGAFHAVVLDPASSERAADLLKRYLLEFGGHENARFSHASMSASSTAFSASNSHDTVLTFRNVHSWMSRDMVEKAFAEFYETLKPGGVLCVIEHRLPSGATQDPKAPSGYVQEAMVKALAGEAGFIFEAGSDVNTNPLDTADHPFGVWTLRPVKRSPRNDEEKQRFPDFDRAAYDAIGESDRMTLRFRKPVNEETSP